MSYFLTLSTHIRVNPHNLWETSTHHRISNTDANDITDEY